MPQTLFFHLFWRNAVSFHFAIQGGFADLELFDNLRDPAAVTFEGAFQDDPLELGKSCFKRLFEHDRLDSTPSFIFLLLRRILAEIKILKAECIAFRKKYGALYDIFEFPDISRPAVVQELAYNFIWYEFDVLLKGGAEFFNKMGDQRKDIFPSFAKGEILLLQFLELI